MRKLIAALVLGPLLGCSGSSDDSSSSDVTPPELEVLTPPRGSVSDSTAIVVRGTVADAESKVASVTVNGETAEVSKDGSFSVTLEVPEAVTILETVATDAAGNSAGDARAVLAGTLVDQGTPVAEGVAGHVSSAAMSGLSGMVSDLLGGLDWTAIARAQNPVASSGSGCNWYKVYVDDVAHGGILADNGAVSGGIRADMSVTSLVVHGHVDWRALCGSGSSNWTITADAYDMAGVIQPRVNAGAISISLADMSSRFENFNLDVSGAPGWVEDQFEDDVRDELAKILRNKAREQIPPQAQNFLAEFVADSWEVNVLGQTVHVSIKPSAMSWTAQGGTIVLDTSAHVEEAEGALYLRSSRPYPNQSEMSSSGLAVAVADDALNQLLAAIWNSGALEDAVIPADADALGALFGGEVEKATMTMMLPPVASFHTEADARLTIGDLMVEVDGKGGELLARFAISAEIELSVEATEDGRFRVRTRAPRIVPQVLEQSPNLLTELDNAKVTAFAEIVVKQLSRRADDLLGTLPVPALGNGTIVSPSVQPLAGYLLMGSEVSFQ